MLRVCEIFESVQGEGLLTGTPSVFLRTSGCNLRCVWCDTPYASFDPEGVAEPWESAVATVLATEPRYVVVTGGEPMLPRDVVPVTQAFSSAGRHVTIETAATVFRDVTCDLMSISPKRANSTPVGTRYADRHDRLRDDPEVVRRLLDRFNCQFKFVCETPVDADDAAAYVDRFPSIDRTQVFLMPEGRLQTVLTDRARWLQPLAERHGFRYGPRLHVELFGDTRGT